MIQILLIVHLVIALAMIAVVLLQRSEGGGLGIGGGGGGGMAGFMTGRGTANMLTRTTAILATLFMVSSITLAILTGSSRTSAPTSILDTGTPPAAGESQAPAGSGGAAAPGSTSGTAPATGGAAKSEPAAPSVPVQ
ncbi:preprotein translocase subunit SecG [Tistlia consotensis]|uniref:Protein-export membrane protein SecG n=1 Tax=Tistlia consotensis USBA 355 TaxID=560819 RepID=A0A1Y6CKL5_9PROT|nr:preprotein translocase subunit SecG [Tistlia consotensis]SMF69646.1 preprotein translocase subunit SecG [Tistlia consotensis USBA 355]SNS05572.1 preprotein translocase subunit SecG [Tistlia consotensis]